jgi:hypothetical protein
MSSICSGDPNGRYRDISDAEWKTTRTEILNTSPADRAG